VSVIFTSSVIHAQYKIKGPGISPSKDTVYAGIPYEYRVVNFPNTRSLMWQFLWGVSDTKEGEVVHITWDNVPESRITVTGLNGNSYVTMEAVVKISGVKPQPVKPEVPKFVKMETVDNGVRKYYFTNVKNASSYKWTLPSGCCETTRRHIGSFILKKNIEDNNVILFVKNTQAYCKGMIQVQAIIDDGGLYSDVNSVEYKYLDESYIKINVPDTISLNDQKTFTAEITKIAGATYQWKIDDAIIVNGDGTNKISFTLKDPLVWLSIHVTILIDGKSLSRIKNIFVLDTVHINGPDVIYGDESVEYTLSTTIDISNDQFIYWFRDDYGNILQMEGKVLCLHGNQLSEGIHSIGVVFGIYDTMARKTVIKYNNKPYSVTYNQILNSVIVSRTSSSGFYNRNNLNNLLVQIYDIQGSMKYSESMSEKEYNKNINMGYLKKGIYIVTINDGTYKDSQTIMVY